MTNFLSFEWEKIILPLIVIFLFSYQIYVYYSLSKINESVPCEVYEFQKTIETYQSQNDTELINRAWGEWEQKSNQLQKDLYDSKGNEILIGISQKIDPFFPAPCEFVSNSYCRYYMDETAYDCTKKVMGSIVLNSLFETKMPEYKRVSIIVIVIHFVILSLLAYLVSAILLFLIRNIKIKKKWD